MGEDHNLDRRYQDQSFKLKVTSEMAELKVNLQHNTDETKAVREKVDSLHNEMERAFKGSGPLDTGLSGQTLENKVAIDQLKGYLKVWLPIVGMIVFLCADQISPIIREWLYQKTRLKVFYSVAQDFKEKKSIQHVRIYKIYQKPDPPEETGAVDDSSSR